MRGLGQPVPNVFGIDRRAVYVANIDRAALTIRILPAPLRPFLRGNTNGDARVDLADPVATLDFLFRGGPTPTCLDAADANDDGKVDTTDAVFEIRYPLATGPSPPSPFPACGPDPSDAAGEGDGLSCECGAPCG